MAQQGLEDRKLQDYYEAMQEMFATKGWAYFLEDVQKIYAAADSILGVKNNEDLHFRLGQLDILRLVVSQPAVIEKAYQNALEDEHGLPTV